MPFNGKARILICTPCYGNQIANSYFLSILESIATFAGDPTIELSVFTLGNESLVTRARNVCVATFLRGDYTHLLFIDSDIGFKPDVIRRLVDKNDDIVCAVYPQKTIAWEKLRSMNPVEIRGSSDADLAAKVLKYNVHVSTQMGEYKREVVNGFMEVDRAATGFMMIKRTVFTKMMKAYPELKYESDDAAEDALEKWLWAFFDCIIDDRKKYLSEDYAFCERWKKIGGKIWIDVMSPLSHVGSYTFAGHVFHSLNMRKTPQKQQQQDNDLVVV